MPDLKLLCDRPVAQLIDFSAARLVVGTANGLNVNGQKLAMGEEIPPGALPAEALRCEYETPLRRIELYDFAMKDPELREAIIRHRKPGSGDGSGPSPESSSPSPSPQPPAPQAEAKVEAPRPPVRPVPPGKRTKKGK